jgi:hypothetical protein
VRQYTRDYKIANRDAVNANQRRYYRENSDTLKAKKKIRYSENPLKFQKRTRAAKLKFEYGLTAGKYDMMVMLQAGRCAICAGPPVNHKRLVVDHCHVSGTVRGLLCHNCNVALGLFKDNAVIVERALKYLQRPRHADQSIERLRKADSQSRRDRRVKKAEVPA